jgi:hypothetical protein
MSIEDVSLWLHVNGKNGRFFHDPNMRKAFQTLVKKMFKENADFINSLPRRFRLDFQTFLPLQAGRLPDSEVDRIIAEGEPFVNELIEKSKKVPIKAAISGSLSFVVPLLQKTGLVFENADIKSSLEVFDEMYKKNSFDILAMGASVHTSDPDGIYHLLGRHGAITSQMIQREKVAEQLEKGRLLTDLAEISAHYENVNRTIIEEVPGVHLGFSSSNYVFNPKKVRINQEYIERHFDLFWKVFNFK